MTSIQKTIIAGVAILAVVFLGSIYWSPYNTCVRSQMEDTPPASRADANLICARWIKAN
jgi:hypothetical protein